MISRAVHHKPIAHECLRIPARFSRTASDLLAQMSQRQGKILLLQGDSFRHAQLRRRKAPYRRYVVFDHQVAHLLSGVLRDGYYAYFDILKAAEV